MGVINPWRKIPLLLQTFHYLQSNLTLQSSCGCERHRVCCAIYVWCRVKVKSLPIAAAPAAPPPLHTATARCPAHHCRTPRTSYFALSHCRTPLSPATNSLRRRRNSEARRAYELSMYSTYSTEYRVPSTRASTCTETLACLLSFFFSREHRCMRNTSNRQSFGRVGNLYSDEFILPKCIAIL